MSHIAYIIEGVVADGTLINSGMSRSYERTYISVVYYSDDFITIVIPTAGTLTFEASETGEDFGTIPNGIVDVTDTDYARPNFLGSVDSVNATALGISGNGVLNYRATINRFGER